MYILLHTTQGLQSVVPNLQYTQHQEKKLDTYASPMHTYVKFALGAFGRYVGSFGPTD
jgi:hypothetical protein